MKLHEGVKTNRQQSALWGSAFAFTVCFAVWTIFHGLLVGVAVPEAT